VITENQTAEGSFEIPDLALSQFLIGHNDDAHIPLKLALKSLSSVAVL
jgi:hypothetical protein